MSKFCPECGSKLPDAAAFCGNCGKDVRRPVSPAEPAPMPAVPARGATANSAPTTATSAPKQTASKPAAPARGAAANSAPTAATSAPKQTAPIPAAPAQGAAANSAPTTATSAPKQTTSKQSVPKQAASKQAAPRPNSARPSADSYKVVVAASEAGMAAQAGTSASFAKTVAGFFGGKHIKSLLGCGAILFVTGLMGLLFIGSAIASIDDNKKASVLLPAAAPQKPCVAIEHAVPADLAPGDFVTFGRYPQGIDGAVHPLQWRVLENDGVTVLLWSRYGIDARPFDYYDKEARWEKSSLRRWLGTVFINKAFTPNEQELIAESANINFLADLYKDYFDDKTRQEYEKALVDSEAMAAYAKKKTYGNEEKSELGLTEDKIFLLSYDEVKYYLDEKEKRYVYPTATSLLLGAPKSEQGLTNCWLRSTSIKDWACYLREDGDMDNLSALKTCSVVPALRLKIK